MLKDKSDQNDSKALCCIIERKTFFYKNRTLEITFLVQLLGGCILNELWLPGEHGENVSHLMGR